MAFTVELIIEQWLKDYGYDGLFNDDCECGCEIGDLCPCCEPSIWYCQAGYKTKTSEDSQYDFIIGPKKPATKIDQNE